MSSPCFSVESLRLVNKSVQSSWDQQMGVMGKKAGFLELGIVSSQHNIVPDSCFVETSDA